MSAAELVIAWSTALAMTGVVAVGAVVRYEHAADLVRAHGGGRDGSLNPLTVALVGGNLSCQTFA